MIPEINSGRWLIKSCFRSGISGPACTCTTRLPYPRSWSTCGTCSSCERVKTSTWMPISPRKRVRSRTYTFIPPVSLPPKVAKGQVWYEIIAILKLHLSDLPFADFPCIISTLYLHATVAQPAEQPLRKRRVKGSIPFGGFILYVGMLLRFSPPVGDILVNGLICF